MNPRSNQHGNKPKSKQKNEPEKPQQQVANQNKEQVSRKQFQEYLNKLFSKEEDKLLLHENKKSAILIKSWKCHSCGKLNWWLRAICKICGDHQIKPFQRMKPLSPGELQWFDYLFFVDYECNQIENSDFEIIEFPIVVVDVKKQKIINIYETFVKPENKITKFITNLTTITNQDVAKAPNLRNTILDVTEFLKIYTQDLSKPNRCAVVYDNRSDADFLWNETTAKKIKLPKILTTYINIKDVFPVIFSTPPRAPKSLDDMQTILKQSFQGTKHRGVDDATNQANVGIECLIRGYKLKKDMLVSIDPKMAPRVEDQQYDASIEVIIHLEFDIEKSAEEIQEKRKDEEEKKIKYHQDMEKGEENMRKNNDNKNHESRPKSNSKTKENIVEEQKRLKIDCIRSCSYAISILNPKTNQFSLSSSGLQTIKMFDQQNKNKSKKSIEPNSQDQEPDTLKQLEVFKQAAIQIAFFIESEISLKSKRSILITSNKSHNLTTQLFLDSIQQIFQEKNAELDLVTRKLVFHLNYFTIFTRSIIGMMKLTHEAQQYFRQFGKINQVMGSFSLKSAKERIVITIETINYLKQETGECILGMRYVKNVF